MSYAEGRYWITYNGEIYNYPALREELRGLGHVFHINNELAGYCSVLHSLQLQGLTGHYGPFKKAVPQKPVMVPNV